MRPLKGHSSTLISLSFFYITMPIVGWKQQQNCWPDWPQDLANSKCFHWFVSSIITTLVEFNGCLTSFSWKRSSETSMRKFTKQGSLGYTSLFYTAYWKINGASIKTGVIKGWLLIYDTSFH